MGYFKCKNSVLCISFSALFLLGTIFGVVLFQLGYDNDPNIFLYYGSLGNEWGFVLWPLLLVAALNFVSWGWRVIPTVLLVRGALMAYTVCALYVSDQNLLRYALHSLILLPFFFFFVFGTARRLE